METKPGIKSTEFWLTLLANVLGIAALIVGAASPESPVLEYIGGAITILANLGYGTSRAIVKSSEIKAKAVREVALAKKQ